MVVSSNSIEIQSLEGRVRGLAEDGLAVFRGVPFAQAPVGSLRFKAPVRPSPRAAVLDATHPAPMCPQPPLRLFKVLGDFIGEQAEDCLTSTIWAPLPLDRPRPILVWLHGGAFASGSGSHPWYDGATLARDNDIVVVGPNYRLGALGFLCRPGLVDGNMGLLDQIRAIEWIKDNAACFGGDPNQITLMGQSGGAMSVTWMLAFPKVRSLFQRAVFLSGGFVSPAVLQPAADAIETADRYCAKLNIDAEAPDGLRKLQEAPLAQILEAQLAVGREAIRTPGSVIPTFTVSAVGGLSSGAAALEASIKDGAAGIDALFGMTTEEFRAFQGFDPRLADLKPEALPKVAEALLGESWASLIEQARRARPGATPTAMVSDAYAERFVRGFRQLAIAVAKGKGKAWLYRFDWSAPNSQYGACHCLDLPFVFGTFDAFKGAPMLAGADRSSVDALSRVMRSAIGRFVKSGSPAGPDLPKWPPFSRSQPVEMVFNSVLQRGWLDVEEI